MPDGLLGFIIDGIVIALLIGTIITTLVMYRKLQALRSVRGDFETMITDFMRAASRAEDALKGMTLTAEDVSERLDKAIQRGELTTSELQVLVESGDRIAARMEAAIEHAPRPQEDYEELMLEDEYIEEDEEPDYNALAQRAAAQMIGESSLDQSAPAGRRATTTDDIDAAIAALDAEPSLSEVLASADHAYQGSTRKAPAAPAPLREDRDADQGMSNVFRQAEAQGIDPFDALFGDEPPMGLRKVAAGNGAGSRAPAPPARKPQDGGASRSEQELMAALAARRTASN